MGIITFLILVVIVGVVLWFIENYVPMSPPIKVLLRVVVIVVLLVVLLEMLGVFSPHAVRLGGVGLVGWSAYLAGVVRESDRL